MEKVLRISGISFISVEKVKLTAWVLSSAILMFFALRGFLLGFRLANWMDAVVFVVTTFLTVYLRWELEHRSFRDKEKLMPFVISIEYLCVFTVLSGIIMIAQYGAVWGRHLIMHDSYLMKLDSLFFGFNWFKFNNLVMSHKILTEAVNFIYSLITPSMAVIIVMLAIKNETEVTRFFLFMLITSAITVFVFHFYPVVGPVKDPSVSALFWLVDHAYLPSIKAASLKQGVFILGVKSLDGINAVHTGGAYVMRGAICFPSYHAVLAFGYMYFSKNFSKAARIIFITMSVLMCVAAIPAGNHFLVDILAGGLVALIGITALPSRVEPVLRFFQGVVQCC